jgi:hypothetical protein
MTTDRDFDRQIQDYLQSGPAELADRVLWAARAQLKTTRRRQARFGWLMPWRDIRMNQSTRLLVTAGAALAVVVAIGAGILGPTRKDDAGGGPSASPSAPAASPSQAASPSSRSSPSVRTSFPTLPPSSAVSLTAAWETAGGPATTFGLAEVGPDGRIWAPSSVDNAFRILTPGGKLSETWGTPGSGDGEFDFTIGTFANGAIAFAPDGGFWVLDSGNFRVQRFDRNRKFLGAWGRFGTGEGEFSLPIDIAVDDAGNVFVGDDIRLDIQVFTSGGQFVRTVAPGKFVSANGVGYVTTDLLPDGRRGIAEYKPDGSVQGGIDMAAVMAEPMGIARDDQGDIFVVGLDSAGNPGTMVRLAANGDLNDVWDAGGVAVAVTPDGTAAYVIEPSDTATTIKKYVIPGP